MITSVSHSPHTYTPAWAPIVWTVNSDNTTSDGFLYVFDVFLKGATTDTRISRVKQPANPAGSASLDVAPIVQPYLKPADVLLEVDRALGATAQFIQSSDLMQGVYLKVGEEISGTIYTGLTGSTAAGDPGYTASSRDGLYVRAFAGAQNILQARTNDVTGPTGASSTASFYGSYSPYVMGWTATNFVGGRFLTGLTSNNVRLEDRHTLAFFNRSIGDGPDFGNPWAAQVMKFDSQDNVTYDYLYNLTTNGGGPRVTSDEVLTSSSWVLPSQEMSAVAVGPVDLGLTSSTSNYKIRMLNWSGVSHILAGGAMSDYVHFTLYEDCSGNFPSIRFSWLNAFGGRDYFNFNKYYEEDFAAKSDTYFKDPNDWSSSVWALFPWKSGNTVYNREITRSVRVMSDWLSQEEIEFLKTMFESPNVLVYLPGESLPQTCTVKDVQYFKKMKIAQKMYNLEFTLEMSFGDKVQNT